MSTGKRHIKELKVKCDNEENGCQWVGALKSVTKHTDNCEFKLVPCPNGCMSEGSEVILLLKDVPLHVTTTCLNRLVSCPLCNLEVKQGELELIHPGKCAKVIISCPNVGCDVKTERAKLEAHLSSCEFKPVPCKYAHIGCPAVVSRRMLESHEDDHQFHLDLAMEAISKMSLSVMASPSMQHTFKMTNFMQLQASDQTYYSPPFYTHQGGYKFCVRIHANGMSSGHETHISVYVHLMRGENDKNLSWPFSGEVTLELLNQYGDDSHHKKVLTFPTQIRNINQRVIDGERCKYALGYQKFLSHDKCYHDKPAYIVNDTLYFRVSVNATVNKSQKPWLSCTI